MTSPCNLLQSESAEQLRVGTVAAAAITASVHSRSSARTLLGKEPFQPRLPVDLSSGPRNHKLDYRSICMVTVAAAAAEASRASDKSRAYHSNQQRNGAALCWTSDARRMVFTSVNYKLQPPLRAASYVTLRRVMRRSSAIAYRGICYVPTQMRILL